MALTATAQSALPGPSWDETIVPALRKRLQSESRTLTKRMSVVSTASSEEQSYTNPTPTTNTTTSSSIPRPSIQSTRSSDTRVTSPPIKQRSRTQSTPFVHDPTTMGRPADVKPTRIPTRSRAASITPRVESRNSHQQSPDASANAPPELWAVSEVASSAHSHSTVDIPRHQHSGLLNEPIPFATAGNAVPQDYEPPRQSNESEERPFEHWYRGESSRNGGVGELRVGRRAEMLEIANYGHTVRKLEMARTKTAPEYVAIEKQESFYMEDEQPRGPRVLDENPLTDLETDDDEDIDSYYNHSNGDTTAHSIRSAVAAAPVNGSVNGHRANSPPSRIPGPSQRAPTPTMAPAQTPTVSRTPTPTAQSMQRGASEPPLGTPRATQPQPPTPVRTPSETRNAAAAQRRAKSPASTASKKANAAKLQAKRELENRRSVAQYPAPADGIDMEHAIPSWTEPVHTDGNWDNVVLPVVARKKGLDGQYEVADGSPKPKKPDRIPPAPGTFGYDWSKYRPPRDDNENISLDEFGRQGGNVRHSLAEERREEPEQQREPQQQQQEPRPTPTPRTLASPSPAPFAHYAPAVEKQQPGGAKLPPPQIRPSADNGAPQNMVIDEDEGAGCCKCTIM